MKSALKKRHGIWLGVLGMRQIYMRRMMRQVGEAAQLFTMPGAFVVFRKSDLIALRRP